MGVLVVDDEASFRLIMEKRLAASGHRVECVESGEAALASLSAHAVDVVLLDLRMPGLGGLETLRQIRNAGLACEVVVLTGQPDYDDCVEAMKLGAFHYLRKPTEPALIEDTLRRAADHFQLRRENAALRRMLHPERQIEFVGDSPAIRAILDQAGRIAASDSRVVILGESGTGKGLLARMLHAGSPRRAKPFMDLHCGAIPNEIQESELFGHERGAFTGAVSKTQALQAGRRWHAVPRRVRRDDARMQTKLLRCWRPASSAGSAACGRSPSACASWSPPTRTPTSWSGQDACGQTCCTAST
jgi:DNA-binding NtrC family response regulator